MRTFIVMNIMGRPWFIALILTVALEGAYAQTVAAQSPKGSKDNSVRAPTIRKLTIPAPAGAVVVRVGWRSYLLPSLQDIAKAFPAGGKLDINYDDYASFGRFCDDDNPYHVVIDEGSRTAHDQWCLQRRFPAGAPQPEEFLLGHFRVVFVVHKNNPIRSLNFAGIRKALCQKCKDLRWRNIGGAGTAAIHCFGPPENTWLRQFIQDKCMSRWCDTDQPGVRKLQKLKYRKDIVACANANEIIAKVRKDRFGFGFFTIGEELTEQTLQGVRVVPVATKQGDQAIAPTLETIVKETYPLSEPVSLYVHPNAPAVAHEFAKFATGSGAAKIVKQCGLWPEYDLEQICGKQRLAKLRRGKGVTITVCDLTGRERLLNDLAAKFVEAKETVRLKVQKDTRQGVKHGRATKEIIERFFEKGSELVLVNESSGQWSVASGQSRSQSPGDSAPRSIQSVVLGRMAVGVVVHPKNSLAGLPLNELRGIFLGKIRQWPGVTGPSAAIHTYGLYYTNQITQLLQERLTTYRTKLKFTPFTDDDKVIRAVAQDPAAIGFVDLSQLRPDDKSVKLVPIYDKAESGERKSEYVVGGSSVISNPFSRTFRLHISPNASQTAKDFARFVASDHCTETLARHGIISPSRNAPAITTDQKPGQKSAAQVQQPKAGNSHPKKKP